MPGNRSLIQTWEECFVQPKQVTQTVTAMESAVPRKCLMRMVQLQPGEELWFGRWCWEFNYECGFLKCNQETWYQPISND